MEGFGMVVSQGLSYTVIRWSVAEVFFPLYLPYTYTCGLPSLSL